MKQRKRLQSSNNDIQVFTSFINTSNYVDTRSAHTFNSYKDLSQMNSIDDSIMNYHAPILSK